MNYAVGRLTQGRDVFYSVHFHKKERDGCFRDFHQVFIQLIATISVFNTLAPRFRAVPLRCLVVPKSVPTLSLWYIDWFEPVR